MGIALSAGLFLYYIFYAPPGEGPLPAEIRVEQGDSLATVARKLSDQKIVSNGFLFSLWARLSGAEKKIHPGLYRFEAKVPPRDVLERLVMGKGIFQTVTIPEGLTVREIAALLENMQIANKEKFLAAAADPNLLAGLGLQDKGIEGYLFPSTYHFVPSTPERDVILTMAEQFRKISLPLLAQREGNSKLTAHEILTLASIIEKETGVESERPLVSAVFHNRLQRQMALQSDPTVIYGLKDFNGNLTRKVSLLRVEKRWYPFVFRHDRGPQPRGENLPTRSRTREPRQVLAAALALIRLSLQRRHVIVLCHAVRAG